MVHIVDREMRIPSSEECIGYVGDHKTEVRQFCIADSALSEFSFKLDLKSKSRIGIVDLEKTIEGNNIILTWVIQKAHLLETGMLFAQLRAIHGEDEVWHSETKNFWVNEAINATEYYESPLPSEFEEIERRITDAHNDITQNKNLVLEKSIEVSANTQLVTENTSTVMTKAGNVTDAAATAASKAQEAEHYAQLSQTHAANAENQAQSVVNGIGQAQLLLSNLTGYTYPKAELYSRQSANSRFAYAFEKSVSGAAIVLPDIQANSNLIALTQKGDTFLAHSGTVSPFNPCVISGISNAAVSINAQPYSAPPQKSLYKLSNGVKDTFDLISGQEKHYIEKIVLTGSTSITYSAILSTDNTFVFSVAMPGQYTGLDRGYIASHFTIGSGSSPYVIYVPQNNDNVYFKLSDYSWLSITADDTAAQRQTKIRNWLAAQYTAGTPVTIYYQLSTPTVIARTPQTINITSETATLTAEKGTLDVRYCRSSNAVLQELVSAILILGGSI